MRVEYATLAMQVIIIFVVSGSAIFALRTKRNIGKTLEAIYQYRREIAWMESRLDAMERKTVKEPQVIEGKSNARPN